MVLSLLMAFSCLFAYKVLPLSRVPHKTKTILKFKTAISRFKPPKYHNPLKVDCINHLEQSGLRMHYSVCVCVCVFICMCVCVCVCVCLCCVRVHLKCTVCTNVHHSKCYTNNRIAVRIFAERFGSHIFSVGHSLYKIIMYSAVSWQDADDSCSRELGDRASLVSIDTEAEYSSIVGMLNSMEITDDLWISSSAVTDGGRGYTKWAQCHPRK